MKQYTVFQKRFNEKIFGRGTRGLSGFEELLNKYAQDGWTLHTLAMVPTRDDRTQLTTVVFERDIPEQS